MDSIDNIIEPEEQPEDLSDPGNHHYIMIDDRGRIIGSWSDGPHPQKDTAGAVCINEQGGYQFRLVIGGKETEENPSLWDMDGIPIYKYEDGKVVSRTEEELAADRAALPKPEDKPSPEERIAELEATLAALLGGETNG